MMENAMEKFLFSVPELSADKAKTHKHGNLHSVPLGVSTRATVLHMKKGFTFCCAENHAKYMVF